jgi:hypothetical protein
MYSIYKFVPKIKSPPLYENSRGLLMGREHESYFTIIILFVEIFIPSIMSE